MFSNIQEEIEFWSPNPSLEAQIVDVGEHKLCIIDNFWKNPKAIQKLAMDIPATYHPDVVSGTPGSRVDVSFYFTHLYEVFVEPIKQIYGKQIHENSFRHATFQINRLKGEDKLPPRLPHVDHMDSDKFAIGIFLNDDQDCCGGTAFYTYQNKQIVDMVKEGLTTEHYVQDSEHDIEKIYTAEMKFNRCILYPANILHTAYIPNNSFKSFPRLMQMFFI